MNNPRISPRFARFLAAAPVAKNWVGRTLVPDELPMVLLILIEASTDAYLSASPESGSARCIGIIDNSSRLKPTRTLDGTSPAKPTFSPKLVPVPKKKGRRCPFSVSLVSLVTSGGWYWVTSSAAVPVAYSCLIFGENGERSELI